MKTTNKEDIRLLKSKHRLELVMQTAGESFEIDTTKPDLWHSTITPGLTVDIRRQMYEVKMPGKETETGDVFTWLQKRFTWSFTMTLNYLNKRAPDPKREVQLEKKNQFIHIDEDEIKPLDSLQEKALKIGGERMREYFSWSWWDLMQYMPETRIEPTHAPSVTHCAHCENQMKWHIEKERVAVSDPGQNAHVIKHVGPLPRIAYSVKRRLSVGEYGLEGSKTLKEVYREAQINQSLQEKINWAIANSFDGLIDAAGALFVEEEDGVVCETCAWREYDFQFALVLCKKSARKREDEDAETKPYFIIQERVDYE